MQRIYSFMAAALTLITAASCVQELQNDAQHPEDAVVYKAIADGADTKAVLGTNESGRPQSMWEDGDIIKIYPGGGMSYSFVTSLKEPSSVAEFKYSGYDNVDFSDVSVVLASFPASTARWADPQQENIMMQSEISTSQNVESDVDSYSRNAVPAVAYSADRTLHFQNAAALLKFQVNQDRVSRVRLTARHGEIITGMICIYLDAEHKISNILPDEYAYNAQETHKSYAELSSDGTFQSDRTYYLSIIPGTLESGFILEFFDANGTVIYTKDYDRSITIKRNVILDMGTLGKSASVESGDYIDEYGINHGPGVEIDGVVWAPVNCGYHETDYQWGKLYQWGRKYGQGYDGNFYDGDWDQDYSDVTYPEIEEGPVSFCEGQDVNSSNKFYLGEDWSDNYHSDIWNLGNEYNPIKTEYDPCPDGWRIPTISELELMYQNHSSFTTNGEQMGYWFSGSSPYSSDVPQVFLPAAGRRSYSKGKAIDRGYYGLYWSSTSDYPVAKRFRFYDDNFGTGSNCRAYGLSVRCVQDDSELIPVSSVTLNTSSLMMQPGTRSSIYTIVAPSNANHQSAYWSSSNTSVATVEYGTVIAVSPGTATITAMVGMKTATCEVTVKHPETEGTREVTLWRGETMVDDRSTNHILSDGGSELLAAGAQPGDMVCFYVEPMEDYWEVEIWEGHWVSTYLSAVSYEYNLADNGGRIILPLTREILDAAYMPQMWGGTFLLLGDNLKLTKVTLLTSSPDLPSSLDDYIDEYGVNHGPGVEIDGVVWAPVNCGYHETDYQWGKLYQWGRKYGQGYSDETYVDATQPVMAECNMSIQNLQSAENEDVWYTNLNKVYEHFGMEQMSSFWNAGTEENPVKSEYDPCPENWRLPTSSEFSDVIVNWASNVINGQTGMWFCGSETYFDTYSRLFLQSCGFRNLDGEAMYRNTTGAYASSNASDYYLQFWWGHAEVISNNQTFDSGSFSVRCVQDDSELVLVEELILDKTEITLAKGESYTLSATISPANANHQCALWSSEDTSVAVVDKNGQVNALKVGTTTITAVAGMKAVQCEVTVVAKDVTLIDYVDEYDVNHGKGVNIDGVVWAPVNCGYHETDFKYGKLYQWGRKYGQGYSGRLCDLEGNTTDQVSDAILPTFDEGPVSAFIANQDSNANVFYKGKEQYNWNYLESQEDDLWNAGTESDPIKSEYDPCPDGWRVPTYAELNALSQNYSEMFVNDEGEIGSWYSGSNHYTTEASRIFLLAAGGRGNSGECFSGRGGSGRYRSSKLSGSEASFLIFSIGGVSFMSQGDSPANGYSVRCVQE